ncbi:MAG: Uma2 family endonuclease [Deltaproteobacteria bacterium]|nr:MAG: Uma2 family endonuclease [Deltaproteobacteria bacterium]
MTEKEYLEIECQAEYKSEYFDGQMFAMSGASRAHNLIVANLIISLGIQLKSSPCRVYPSDMRLKVRENGLYTYPDVTVVCDEEKFDDEQQDTLTNPLLIIEVLSKSTEAYDRGAKFAMYRQLGSLAEYILVDQSQPLVEQYVRQEENHWLLSETKGTDAVVTLSAVNASLSLADIYDKVG